LALLGTAAAQVTVSGDGASNPNGLSALEGTAVSPSSSSYDTMWADSTDGRWKVNNHNNGPQDLGVWPCRAAAGTVVYSSTTAVSGVYPEACVPIGTAGQILMLSGSTPAPGWSSSYVSSVAGTSNQINVSGTGSLTLSIANPFIFPGKATLAASTASNESLNIPSGTPPTSPVTGAVFFDGTELYFNDGSASQPHPRIVRLAADSSASTSTSMANLSGMSFSLAASTNYTVSCDLFYLVSATTRGLAVNLHGSGKPGKRDLRRL